MSSDDRSASRGGLDVELVTLANGERAVRDRLTGEVMHSAVGPREEPMQLYVKAARLEERLASAADSPLVLLDVGLGAGSNAALAFALSESRTNGAGTRRLQIVSFDRSTAAMELALGEHAQALGFTDAARAAGRALLEHGHAEAAHTSWRLSLGDLPGTLRALPHDVADVVFWDPFSPRANPTLWGVAAFSALRLACRDGCTVHTYSQATRVRSALLLAGFHVGLGVATGHKETTTIAGVGAPRGAALLDRRWLERLNRSSAPLPDDVDPKDALDALARIAAHPQFM